MSRLALRLPVELILEHLQQVAAVAITPMGDQLELLGVVFNESCEELYRAALSLNICLLALLVLRAVRHGASRWLLQLVAGAYTPGISGGD